MPGMFREQQGGPLSGVQRARGSLVDEGGQEGNEGWVAKRAGPAATAPTAVTTAAASDTPIILGYKEKGERYGKET